MRQRTASGVIWVGVTTMGLLALVPAGALASTVSTRIKRVFYAAAPARSTTSPSHSPALTSHFPTPGPP